MAPGLEITTGAACARASRMAPAEAFPALPAAGQAWDCEGVCWHAWRVACVLFAVLIFTFQSIAPLSCAKGSLLQAACRKLSGVLSWLPCWAQAARRCS